MADFSLERGIGGCLTAFVIDSLFQSRPEIFDQPKGGNTRRLGFLGTNLICCCKKARVLFSMWGYGQMGLETDGIELGADGIRGKCSWPAPTWQTTPWTSCNNRSSLFPKELTLLASLPLGWVALKKAF